MVRTTIAPARSQVVIDEDPAISTGECIFSTLDVEQIVLRVSVSYNANITVYRLAADSESVKLNICLRRPESDSFNGKN